MVASFHPYDGILGKAQSDSVHNEEGLGRNALSKADILYSHVAMTGGGKAWPMIPSMSSGESNHEIWHENNTALLTSRGEE